MSGDLFRDTPVRYMGYANEVGEAFRALIPTKAVWFTYGVASGYVACDAADKGYLIYKKVPYDPDKKIEQALITSCDALLWQTLASIIIPGFTINRLCWASRFFLTRGTRIKRHRINYISVGLGLAVIPFIVKPIDKAVDHLLDITIRPLLFEKQDE